MFRSNRTFCLSQNQTTYSVAFLVIAWLVIVEGFGKGNISGTYLGQHMSVTQQMSFTRIYRVQQDLTDKMIRMIGHAERINFCEGTHSRKLVVPGLCACIKVHAPRTGTN